MSRQDLKLFIASSGELNEERREFDSVLMQVNKNFRDLHLESSNWEYDTESGSYPGRSRIQDRINPILEESNIAVVLFYSKIGEFTREEYEYAKKKEFKIFLYFKSGFTPETFDQTKNYLELMKFRDDVTKEGAVRYDTYLSTKDFSQKMQLDLDKYLKQKYPTPISAPYTPKKESGPKFHWIHNYTLPKYFVGREKELITLNDLIFETGDKAEKIKIISLIGIGGLGKSCLTRTLIERIKSDDKKLDYCIWYSFSPSFASESGDLFRAITKHILPNEYQSGQETKKSSRYYFELVKDILINNKVLLILDNLESIQSLDDRKSKSFGKIRKGFDLIEELFEIVSDYEQSKIVVTSRTRVVNIYDNAFHEEINLNTLDPLEGVELLKLLGVSGPEKELLKLTNLLGNHALIIKAAGNLIKKKRLEPSQVKDFIGPTFFNSNTEGGKLNEILKEYKKFLSEAQKHFLVMLSYHIRDVSIDSIHILIQDYDSSPISKEEIFEDIVNPLINLGLIEERIIDKKNHFHIHPLMKFAFNNWWSDNPAELAYEVLAEAALAEGDQMTINSIVKVEQLQVYFDIVFYYLKAKKSNAAFVELENNYFVLKKYRQTERIYEMLKEIESLGLDSINDNFLLNVRISETASDVKESIQCMRNALHIDQEENGSLATRYNSLGKLYILNLIQNGYMDEASKAIDKYGLKSDQQVQGYLNYYLGKYEEAVKYLTEYYNTRYDGHDERRLAQRLGPVLMYNGEYLKSEEILKKALQHAKDDDDFCCILPLYQDNIDLAISKNEKELAINLFWEMEDYTEQRGIDNIKVYSYYFLTNQLNWIKSNVDKDLTESIDNNNIVSEIDYNLIYAKYYKISDEEEKATVHIDRAIELSEKHGVYRYNYRLKVVQSETKNIV